MTCSAHSKLTALQREVLDAFFQRERGFFLTGGAALAGFHLGHRTTDDLDLFTPHAAAFERGRFVVADVAAVLGGELQARQDAPGFQRLVLTRAGEGLVIDLVKDVGPQLQAAKPEPAKPAPAAKPEPAKPTPAVKPAPVAASGGSDNRSGLGDGTNPGNGAGKSSSPNQGTSNPSQESKPAPVAVDIKKK